MVNRERFLRMRGQTMVSAAGDKLGEVEEIYLDDETDQPEWAQVNTGRSGTRSSFVPLARATTAGDQIVVPYSEQQIKDAPNLYTDQELSPQQEADLCRHYGLDYPQHRSDSSPPDGGRDTPEPMSRTSTDVRSGPTILEEEHEVTLLGEFPVVHKYVKPV